MDSWRLDRPFLFSAQSYTYSLKMKVSTALFVPILCTSKAADEAHPIFYHDETGVAPITITSDAEVVAATSNSLRGDVFPFIEEEALSMELMIQHLKT